MEGLDDLIYAALNSYLGDFGVRFAARVTTVDSGTYLQIQAWNPRMTSACPAMNDRWTTRIVSTSRADPLSYSLRGDANVAAEEVWPRTSRKRRSSVPPQEPGQHPKDHAGGGANQAGSGDTTVLHWTRTASRKLTDAMSHETNHRRYHLPPLGSNPSTAVQGTTRRELRPSPDHSPGCGRGPNVFITRHTRHAGSAAIHGLGLFARRLGTEEITALGGTPPQTYQAGVCEVMFRQADNTLRRVTFEPDFVPVTQLEHARLGIVTPQMQRVAEREPHLTAAQVRDEVAAGRMVIPANKIHLGYRLDPMAIGRASKRRSTRIWELPLSLRV